MLGGRVVAHEGFAKSLEIRKTLVNGMSAPDAANLSVSCVLYVSDVETLSLL